MRSIYLIKWPRALNDTYLFGSKIIFFENGNVEFKNDKMPPTMDIHFWKSEVGLFNDGFLGGLPLLKKNCEYKIIFKGAVYPKSSVYLEIVFLDEQDDLIEKKIINGFEGTFKYPREAFKYEIHLKNINNLKCDFWGLIVSEKNWGARHSIYLEDNSCICVVKNNIDFCKRLKVKVKLSNKRGDVVDVARLFDGFDVLCLILNNSVKQQYEIDNSIVEIYNEIVNVSKYLSLNLTDDSIEIDDDENNINLSISKVIGSLVGIKNRNTILSNGRLIDLNIEEKNTVRLILNKLKEV
ncbi:accessory Sec system protein Asp3 [Lactiplantibacillus plantarum]|uniref:accessory Sec system protein Asp3 n=1 Tax=Lactiplantibacillus plantarum TaxID=1590 RepID=UPI003965B5F2